MQKSIFKKQEEFANTISFYSALAGCIGVGAGFMLLLKKASGFTYLMLACAVISIAGRIIEKKSERLGGISKYIYLVLFAIAPPAGYYMVETVGRSGLPGLAFSFVYIFVANMYYNYRIVVSYSAITLLVYASAFAVFPDQFYDAAAKGKNAIAWLTLGIAFLISVYISFILQNGREKCSWMSRIKRMRARSLPNC